MGLQVIKLGGSLSDSDLLAEWLNVIEINCQDQVVIVPGGGAFADQVRMAQLKWQFNDTVAHQMALLAMQQMAMLFHGINQKIPVAQSADEIKPALHCHKAVIWSPEIKCISASNVPASWDITSDSLAAWLAIKLVADKLLIVKSAEIPLAYTLSELTALEIVDRAFCQFTKQANFTIEFLNRNDVYNFAQRKSKANDRLSI